jgi:hypothetical protein
MSTHAFTVGQRVKINIEACGTIYLDNPYRFTEYVAGIGDEGEVFSSPGAMPEGWLLVKLDAKDDEGLPLFAPVDPRMLDAA